MATSIGVKLGIDGEAEYRKQLNNIITSTKTLDKQMEELKSSFTDETSAMEKNAKETEILQKKASKLNDEVEMMQKMVAAAADKFGENSTECQKWEASLAKAQTELNNTNAQIQLHQEAATEMNSALGQLTATIDEQTTELESLKNEYINAALEFGENSEEAQALALEITNLSAELEENQTRLEEVTTAAEDLASGTGETKNALEQLTDEIASQQSELDTLRDSYIDAVLEFGEGSDQAQMLAGQISSLSSELQNNKQRLDEATASADGLTGSMSGIAGATAEVGSSTADNIVGQFMPAVQGMADTIEQAGVAGAIAVIASAVKEVGTEAFEMAMNFEQALNDIEVTTLQTGDTLAGLKTTAEQAFIAISDKDASIEGTSAIVGTLNTRLGLADESMRIATEAVNAYATVLGVDGASATNQIVDAMKLWGMVTDDDATNVQNLITVMDMLTVAQADANVSGTEILSSLTSQAGAWQDLGYGMDEAITMLVAYADAGGNTSDISTAMYQAVKNLSGETDNLNGAWQEIMTTLANSNGRFDTLNTTIGNTGLTIEDVFGSKKAGQMIDVFSKGKVSTDQFADGITNASGTLKALYDDTRTTEDELARLFNIAKTGILDNQSLVDGTLIPEIGSVGDAWDKTWSTIGQGISDFFGKIGQMPGKTSQATSGMMSDYDYARRQMSVPIDLSITAPSISYTLTGTGNNKYYTPSVSYRRYADAYDRAMILSAPTIFGAMGNELLVGGDRAGNEVVVGEKHLLDMFTQAVKNAGGQTINVVVNGSEGQDVNELAEIVIDKMQMQIIGSEAVYA